MAVLAVSALNFLQDLLSLELLHLLNGIIEQLLPVPPLDQLKPGLMPFLLATIPKNSDGQAVGDVLAAVTGMV